MIEPQGKLEIVAHAIASCMPCEKCPNPCKAKEHSSTANCVIQWKKTIIEAVEEPQSE